MRNKAHTLAGESQSLWIRACKINDTGQDFVLLGVASMVGSAILGMLLFWGCLSAVLGGGKLALILSAPLGAGLSMLVGYWFYTQWEGAVERAKARKERMKEESTDVERRAKSKDEEADRTQKQTASLMKPSCCPMPYAATYDGWHGTIHTFRFCSKRFADAFGAENARKRV